MNSKDKGVWGQFDYQRTVAQIAKKFGLWKPPLPTQATMSQRAEATIVAFSWKQWVWEIRSKKQSTILDVLDGCSYPRGWSHRLTHQKLASEALHPVAALHLLHTLGNRLISDFQHQILTLCLSSCKYIQNGLPNQESQLQEQTLRNNY